MHSFTWRSRREFIATAGAAGVAFAGGIIASRPPRVFDTDRASHACEVRRRAAELQQSQPRPRRATNDDEGYATKFASFAKALPHHDSGEVDIDAYNALLKALRSGDAQDFENIPIAGVLNLVNPRASYAYGLIGADSHHLDLRAPPAFSSAEAAADVAEDYWHAFLRDIPFAGYATHSLVTAACKDLSRFSSFRGPTRAGAVSPDVLFRGTTDGDLVGPYVSQFLYANIPHGVYTIDQRFRMPRAAANYLLTHEAWLSNQRGAGSSADAVLDDGRRYIRTGRDITRFVHRDYTFQAFLNAALVLLTFGDSYLSSSPYVIKACAAGASSAHWRLPVESGFATFGGPAILDAVTAVANLAIEASWYQKWLLHRRLRPEVFGHRFHRVLRREAEYPIHAELLDSAIREELPRGNFLLPLAYPEGAPAHPSYPAAHAAIAGACATILKAFFREDAPFPGVAEPSDDGLELRPIDNRLTIGGELNKLASNISIARNFAGVHYRSDGAEGMNLGEAVALAFLTDMRQCLPEAFDGFAITKFNGKPVIV